MTRVSTILAAVTLVAGSALAAPALATGYGVGMYFAGADGKVKPTLFRDQDGDMDKASCNARLKYLTKKFYRMVRNNLHEFDGMKLVKSACVDVDTFDFGSN